MNDTFPFRGSRWHEPNPRFRVWDLGWRKIANVFTIADYSSKLGQCSSTSTRINLSSLIFTGQLLA